MCRQNGPIGAPRGGAPVAAPDVGVFRPPGAVAGFEDGPGLPTGWPEGAGAGVRGPMPWGVAGPELNAAHSNSWQGAGFSGHWGGSGRVPADGEIDSRMMELTLEGEALNPVFGSWANPNPGFDLTPDENGLHMTPQQPTSRLMGTFLLPPGSGEGETPENSPPPPPSRQHGKPQVPNVCVYVCVCVCAALARSCSISPSSLLLQEGGGGGGAEKISYLVEILSTRCSWCECVCVYVCMCV